jgi:glycosyltransferase involved in cell wall biosynthesis
MRLDVDLGFDAVPGRTHGPGQALALDLHTLAASLRSRRRLAELLRAGDFSEVRVREGELPMSAVQAAALLSLLAARTSRWVVGDKAFGRSRFVLHAMGHAIRAVPRELMGSVRHALRAARAARRGYGLPRTVARPESALYLRIDPSLKWLGAQVGGAATHTSGVINGLLDNGLEVEVLAVEQPHQTQRARFVEVPPRRIFQLVRGLTYTDYTEQVLRAADGLRADFVYQRYQLGSYAGLELARRLNVPLVLEFNGSEIWVERHWGSGHMRLASMFERLELRNLHEASLVVVVSEPLREYVTSQGVAPERVIVDPNGVDADALAGYRARSPAEWRRRSGLPDAPTVGFIGTFGLWHGVKLLPALIEEVPDTRWILVGDGGLLPEVRAEVTTRGLDDRVLFTGVVEHERALEMLACCDVCVSPHVPNPDGTPFFGSPTKLFEYMGLGKPIVASALDQIAEVIDDGRSGLLVPPANVGAAAAAVRGLIADETLRARLAAGALDRVRSQYTWSAHVWRILDALGADSAVVASSARDEHR